MFDENENLVEEETTENAEEQTAEENVDDNGEVIEDDSNSVEDSKDDAEEKIEEPKVKTYTKEEVDNIKQRTRRRVEYELRKEYDKKYGRAENVIKAGMQKDNFDDALSELEDYYTQEGVKIPPMPQYSERQIEMLAKAEAEEIIELGFDDVKEEVDRLYRIGADRMTSEEKAIFKRLAEYRKIKESQIELASIGVKEEVYNSDKFKNFASQFNSSTPMKTVYELYTKTIDKPQTEKIGSMKNKDSKEEKTYYTPEEVDKLTSKDYDDPKIMERVRRSMEKW